MNSMGSCLIPREILSIIFYEALSIQSYSILFNTLQSIGLSCKLFLDILRDRKFVSKIYKILDIEPGKDLKSLKNIFVPILYQNFFNWFGWEINKNSRHNKIYASLDGKRYKIDAKYVVFSEDFFLLLSNTEIYYLDKSTPPIKMLPVFDHKEGVLNGLDFQNTVSLTETIFGTITVIKIHERYKVYKIIPSKNEKKLYYSLLFISFHMFFEITFVGINFLSGVKSYALECPLYPCFMRFDKKIHAVSPLSAINTGTKTIFIEKRHIHLPFIAYNLRGEPLYTLPGPVRCYLSKFIVYHEKIYDLYDGKLLFTVERPILNITKGKYAYIIHLAS